MADAILTKFCKGCQRTLSVTEFWKNKSGSRKPGLFRLCKDCTRKRRAEKLAERTGIPIPPPDAVQECRLCKRTLHLGMFHRQPLCTNGYGKQCKDCIAEIKKEQYRSKPEWNAHWRKYKYALSADDYERMVREQDGRCALCRRPPGKRSLHVDHDHESGKVRALLCTKCNTGLGCFRDSTGVLRAAIRYLRKHRSPAASGQPCLFSEGNGP